MDNNLAIDVRDLKKSYKALNVLNGVNLQVRQGEIFALLGSNGSGKTTTIKILTTLLKPDGGTAEVNGFDVVKKPRAVRESISLTGQNVAVDEILTGKENMILIGKLRHLSNVEAETERLLKEFDLTEAKDKAVYAYSGGMRRKLDLAMSLLGSPKIIFLDEPTTGLDPEARINMWNTIKSLASSGVTIFLTTQYLDEAEQLADNIAILNEGKIIVNGNLEELKKLLPQGHIEMVEKSPTLEEVFLYLIKNEGRDNDEDKK
ncbi:MAG: ATP-binding cassette domain-containing protein [Oscillospiraceae bacterium]|nr:ATP-binding cassette domain-containing protein [Oscillospiraceae bacterium]